MVRFKYRRRTTIGKTYQAKTEKKTNPLARPLSEQGIEPEYTELKGRERNH